jgi:hypothetical protein
MKIIVIALAALSALAVTEASAQVANLTGPYQCVQNCRGGLYSGRHDDSFRSWEHMATNR